MFFGQPTKRAEWDVILSLETLRKKDKRSCRDIAGIEREREEREREREKKRERERERERESERERERGRHRVTER